MKDNNPDVYVNKLKGNVRHCINKGKYEKALAWISACGNILYQWNQFFTDDDLEEMLFDISKRVVKNQLNKDSTEDNTVLFYDGFGYDTRGLVIVYVKALCNLGYHVAYLAPVSAKGQQPELHNVTCRENIEWVYYRGTRLREKSDFINKMISKFKPSKIFFYSTPYDVAGLVVFNAYAGIVERYFINLTNDAFWLGTKSCDYYIDFNKFGCAISFQYRNIAKDKILLLPFYPYVNKKMPFLGLPSELHDKKIIFSGGSIYKTLGDENNSYYNVVDGLLSKRVDTAFLYAGSESCANLDRIIAKYPGRALYISERKDLYALLKHVTIYLDTYPISGGLMVQYAAIAGKVPLMLKREDDSPLEELIPGQDTLGISFSSVDCLIEEAIRLLNDDDYRCKKEDLIQKSIVSESLFQDHLKSIILNHNTGFQFENDLYTSLNLNNFHESYRKRFILEEACKNAVLQHWVLRINHPSLLIRRIYDRIRSLYRIMINHIFRNGRQVLLK